MLREPFQRERVCAHVCLWLCVWKSLNSHRNPVHLYLVTDSTAKTIMTLAPMFCTQPFIISIHVGNISVQFFFSPCPSTYLLNVKRHKGHKDSLSCNGQQFQMFSCILSIFRLRTCQDTVLSMQRFWQGYLWSQRLLKLASAWLNFSTSLKNLA